MPHTPKIDRDFSDLIESWHMGLLDESDRERLVSRLENDPAARRAFAEAARFEALLHLEYPDTVVYIPKMIRAWHRKPAVWLAAAAAVALLAAVVVMRKHGASRQSIVGASPVSNRSSISSRLIDATPVARVDSVSDLVLNPESLPIKQGSLLEPGTIRIVSGTAELTFFSGARVSLQGPCEFQLKSDFRASLESGRMTAEVPAQAIGFTIHTPTGQLRDLGTAFAVKVNRDGVSDVHVLDGKVEALARDASSVVTLEEKQASRISLDKLVPIKFISEGWPQKPDITSEAELPESVYWSFDKFDGDETMDENGEHPLWMRSARVGDGQVTERLLPGAKGQALGFNGVDQFAESTYRGVSGNKPRTVSLWVKIPPDASYRYPNGILSWGTHEQSRKWQVCWNNGDQGTVGAMRVEFGDGYLIGTSDLRDGVWHHLCVVFLGGEDSDVASHVKLYVDSRLETLSGRRSQFIRTDTESPQAIAVTLGRWLGNWPGKEPFYFCGAVDEVHIFEEALRPSQVARLSRRYKE